MGLTLQNFRDNIRVTLGVDDIDFPNAIVDSWIGKSYWELDAKFPFREKEDSGTFVTVDGTNTYTIADTDFESLTNLAILVNNNTSMPTEFDSQNLDRMTRDWFNQVYNTVVTSKSIPTHYLRNEQKNIILYPTPDDVYTIRYSFEKLLADLVSSSDQPAFPRSWHEVIELGAEWRGFKATGDTKRMIDAQNAQARMIGSAVPIEAREEFDSHRAGVQVPSRSYDDLDYPVKNIRGTRIN